MTVDWLEWLDFLTVACWLALASVGVVLWVRRLLRLYRVVLPEPVDSRDAEYLEAVKRSTWLRLGVKVVLLLGALVALLQLPFLFWAWRAGVLVILSLMLAETIGIDRIRARLARRSEESRSCP